MKNKTLVINVLIAVAAALLFVPGIGSVRLFDWDEINFAESAREMLVTGDWLNVRINFESFWEKPPLFIWMQALSMKVFGVGEFAARFPNALIGIITLLILFNIGRKAEDERFGLMWTLMYAISFLPFLYFKSGIIDPWYNIFIFLSIYFFALYTDPGVADKRMRHAALSALFMGLAINTKGPVAFLIFGLSFIVWLIVRRFRMDFRWKDVGVYALVLALVGGSFYHFVILLFGVTPASFFALSSFRKKALENEGESRIAVLFRWMMISFWVVLILFTIVRTKIVHYSSFCYFPMTFLAAYSATRMMDGKQRFAGWQKGLLIGTSVAFGLLFTALTLFDHFKHLIIPLVHDPFAVSCMEASSQWRGFEPFVGLILIAATIWFCVRFGKDRKWQDFIALACANLLFAMTAILCAVPEIEKYSQASAVDFYVERQGEDCYVQPAYFKSYAHYFYTDRKPENACEDFEWLCRGPIDKPVYFVVKDEPWSVGHFAQDAPEAEFLYQRSGFRFFRRDVPETEVGAAPERSENNI